MTSSVRLSVMMVSVLVLAGCQTAQTTMSVDEAKSLTADFKVSTFSKLPRNADELRNDFKNGGPIPHDCELVQKTRNDLLVGLSERIQRTQSSEEDHGVSVALYNGVEDSMLSGRFDRALNFISMGMLHSDHKPTIARFRSQRARIFAQIGDPIGAETEMQRFFQGVTGYHADWKKGSTGQIFLNAGLASVAHAKGDMLLAEHHYRKLIYNASFSTSSNDNINEAALRSGLIQVLLLQGRLIEAEAEARKAIDRAGVVRLALRAQREVYDTHRYSGTNAGPMAMLASVFLEQGRLDDAAYLAEIAVNMHEIGCSAPESLGLNRARSTLISVLAQQRKWPDVLHQVDTARNALSKFPELFELLFGSSPDFAEAQIYAGDADAGYNILKSQLTKKNTTPAKFSTIKGLLALAAIEQGDRSLALKLFAEALPSLIRGGGENENGGASTVRNGRKDRILKGYMTTLNTMIDEGIQYSADVSISAELLRISSASRLGRVQQAFSASHIRAASGDPELSKLVRQEQDLSQEARTTSETLVYLRFSPDAAGTTQSSETLNSRLQELNSARRALKTEILTRFPEFADFTNPRPMTKIEMAQALKPHQALLAYHVTDQKTYIWAMKKDGQLSFASHNIGQDELFQKINALRKAVDPGPLTSLGDIPDFDVALSNELFKVLLVPVRSGWEGATELLVVPHGPLGALPFSMLAMSSDVPTTDDGTLFDRYKNVSWLVNEVAVTQLPSINTLKGTRNVLNNLVIAKKDASTGSKNTAQKTKAPGIARRPFVGIGDPYFSRKQYRVATAKTVEVATRGLPFRAAPKTRGVDIADLALLPRLPRTRSEIISIANALGADLSRDILLGEKATEQAVRALDLSKYDVISFATHGLVPGDLNGLDQPALALTTPKIGKTDGDGLLSMSEILGLHLDADFAVLSACNTAAADGKGAEAVSGLGRAFFYAGARAILVSNWPVHSAATTELMSNLFGGLAADKSLTRSEALRQTKVKQISEGGYVENGKLSFSYAHPIFWAPFSIVGDGGRAKIRS